MIPSMVTSAMKVFTVKIPNVVRFLFISHLLWVHGKTCGLWNMRPGFESLPDQLDFRILGRLLTSWVTYLGTVTPCE